jgi:hypothetical protein
LGESRWKGWRIINCIRQTHGTDLEEENMLISERKWLGQQWNSGPGHPKLQQYRRRGRGMFSLVVCM